MFSLLGTNLSDLCMHSDLHNLGEERGVKSDEINIAELMRFPTLRSEIAVASIEALERFCEDVNSHKESATGGG